MKMTEFTINRENWMTPDHPGWNHTNSLVNEDETMCCLGFFCNRISRIKKDDMVDVPLPSDLGYDEKPSINAAISKEDELANINDCKKIDAKEREKRIAAIFKTLGYRVKFIGKYKKNDKDQ